MVSYGGHCGLHRTCKKVQIVGVITTWPCDLRVVEIAYCGSFTARNLAKLLCLTFCCNVIQGRDLQPDPRGILLRLSNRGQHEKMFAAILVTGLSAVACMLMEFTYVTCLQYRQLLHYLPNLLIPPGFGCSVVLCPVRASRSGAASR